MKAKANYFRALVVLAVGLLVAVAVALFGVGLRTAETQTTTPEMQVQDLGHLGGGYSGATSINDSGQVVGVSSTSDGKQHAFSTMRVLLPQRCKTWALSEAMVARQGA